MAQRDLPEFIAPMLAKQGEAFDSDDFIFEVKWDGTRALIFVDDDGSNYRIINRHQNEKTTRYPELHGVAAALPKGTIVDGEIIVLNDEGLPQFSLMQVREQAAGHARIRNAARVYPATFVAFDVLYHQFESVMDRPLVDRRELLLELLGGVELPNLAVSDGVIGPGKEFFAQVVAQELEGVVAKRLNSRYVPGMRSDAWLKIKKQKRILCAVIGYVPDGRDLECLLLAANTEEGLRYVGRVGSGLTHRQRDDLLERLPQLVVDKPLVECKDKKAQWLEPVMYVQVRYLEMTSGGELRDPVLEQIVE